MANAAGRLAADGHPMAVQKGAVGNGDILARRSAAPNRMAGLNSHVVIADIQHAFGDANIAAGTRVNRIGVGGIRGRLDRDAFNQDVFALGRHQMKAGRIGQGYTLDAHPWQCDRTTRRGRGRGSGSPFFLASLTGGHQRGPAP